MKSALALTMRVAAAALGLAIVAHLDGCSGREAAPAVVDEPVPLAHLALVRDGRDLVSTAASTSYRLRFSREGAAIERTSDGQRAQLRGVASGRAEALVPFGTAPLVELREGRAVYARGAIEEWYEPKPGGLEQGFTLRIRPPGPGPLTLDVDTGNLGVLAAPGTDRAIDLRVAGATEPTFRYGGLSADDREGRTLPATLTIGGPHTIRILVDDRDATYPLIVDPLVWSLAPGRIRPVSQSLNEEFGYSVAVQGTTLVGSAPARSAGRGGATVFRRSGASWSEEGALLLPAVANFARSGASLALDGERVILGSERAAATFVRSGTTWAREQIIDPPWVSEAGGLRVALQGNRAALLVTQQHAAVAPDGGVTIWDPANGLPPASVFVYERGATTWTLSASLPLPLSSNAYGVGRVLLDHDRLIVGLAGSVTVYRQSVTDGWIVDTVLTGENPLTASFFGIDLALHGSTMFVSDTVYVVPFERSATTWSRGVGFTAPQAMGYTAACFGCGMALDQDVAFVGAPGFTRVFRYRRVSSAGWGLEEAFRHRVLAPNVNTSAPNLALGGNAAFLGDPRESGSGSIAVLLLQSSLGEPCTTPDACASDFCADGVCCDAACGAGRADDCLTCNRPGSVGSCVVAAASTACRTSAGSCDLAETCDGTNRACPADLLRPNGSACADGTCVGGACTALAPDGATPSGPASGAPVDAATSGCATNGGRTSVWGSASCLAMVVLLGWRRRVRRVALLVIVGLTVSWRLEAAPSVWRESQRILPRVPKQSVFTADATTLAVTHYPVAPIAVEVFRKNGTKWSRETELVPFRFSEPSDDFGGALSVSGDTLAVAATTSSTAAPHGGSVFLFQRVNGVWIEQAELAPANLTAFASFGTIVALQGDTLVVAAYIQGEFDDDGVVDRFDDPTAVIGAVYVYTRTSGIWSLTSQLTASASAAFFGYGVALSGNTLMVAAYGRTTPTVHVYERVGSVFQPRAILQNPAEVGAGVGFSIALDGASAAFFGDKRGSVFELIAGAWTQQATLSTGAVEDSFARVSIRGPRIAVGTPLAQAGRGSLAIFDRDGAGAWSLAARLSASDGGPNEFFGLGVAMATPDDILVGARHLPAGQLYDFRLGPEALPCSPATAADDCPVDTFCVDGFCCDQACGGDDPDDCQACSAAKGASHDGVCGPVAPRVCRASRDACDVDDRCDGVNVVCPADVVAENGRACPAGQCISGACASPENLAAADAGALGAGPLGVDGGCACRSSSGSGSATSALVVGAGSLLVFAAALLRRARRRAQVVSVLTLLGALIALPGLARADEEPPSSTAAALAKFDEGRRALEAGQLTTALASFDASNRLLGSPNSVLYMARCYKGLGRTASAYTSFRLAYRQAQDRLVATSDKRYLATRDSAASEAAEIEASVPKLAIIVPEEAAASVVVTQNGAVIPRASWGAAIDTDPGAVTVDVTGTRIEPFHADFELLAGETRRIDVVLTRVPTAILRVQFESRPLGLTIRLDGRPVDLAELSAPRDVDPGPRVVEVSAPGHVPFRWSGTLANGETADVRVRLVEIRNRRVTTPAWLTWTTAGVAAATLGTATVLAAHASVRAGNEKDKDPLLRSADEQGAIRSESTVANVLFVSGAIVATGAGILFLTTDWRGRPTDPRSRASHVVDVLTRGAQF